MAAVKLARIRNAADYPDKGLLKTLERTRLLDARIPEHEIIQFRRLQSLIYSLRVAGYDVEAMQTEAFVGAVLFTFVNCNVAVTRCEYDFEVNLDVLNKIGPRLKNGLVWLTTNANIEHRQIRALPIGITDYCGYSPYHQVIGDSENLKSLIDEQPRSETNLVLLNFNDASAPVFRPFVRKLFKDKEFVTTASYTPSDSGYRDYVQALRAHPFSLAPRGVGIDTHRLWESLYAGCIPIVQKTTALNDFSDLPIFFVDRWEDACDANVLKRVRDDFYERTWDLRKLTLSYWYQVVLDLLNASMTQEAT